MSDLEAQDKITENESQAPSANTSAKGSVGEIGENATEVSNTGASNKTAAVALDWESPDDPACPYNVGQHVNILDPFLLRTPFGIFLANYGL